MHWILLLTYLLTSLCSSFLMVVHFGSAKSKVFTGKKLPVFSRSHFHSKERGEGERESETHTKEVCPIHLLAFMTL